MLNCKVPVDVLGVRGKEGIRVSRWSLRTGTGLAKPTDDLGVVFFPANFESVFPEPTPCDAHPVSRKGGSMGSESSDSERLDDRRLSWVMLVFGGVGSSESRKNWMRSRLSVERRNKEEDILMGAKGILYCRSWLTLKGS